LRRCPIDTAIDLELFSRCTALLTYLCGAARRVGFDRGTSEGLYRGDLLTARVPYNAHLHIALNFLALVAALEAEAGQVPLVKADLRTQITPLPRLQITDEERAATEAILHRECPCLNERTPIFVFNPDPGDALPIRGWPLERFTETAARLLTAVPESVIAVIGLHRSQRYAAAMQAALGAERCLDLTGKTPSLRAMCALLTRAKLLTTNDSGPAHIASLTPTPAVVLFGPETPALYAPLSSNTQNLYGRYSCSPCLSAFNHRHTRCNDNRCLKAISVEEVYHACLAAIGRREVARPPSLYVLDGYDFAA
jgi:ADP-heptose:LPS heptosyltransferase